MSPCGRLQFIREREAMQLINDFKAECACNELEGYIGMVMEDQQNLEGLIQHLKNAFQSGKTISQLISDFYGWTQKKNESKHVFGNDLQVLVWKIIARKPEFRKDANEQFKSQYAHKLKDPYYVAVAHSMLQSSNNMESFIEF